MIIAVDFDGTCVVHKYPEIGRDIGATPVLKDLITAGHQIILWTMRGGDCREKAMAWFKNNNIELFGINGNPHQHEWTDSPKAYAHLYIDDAALGVPLIVGDGDRPYVNWVEVREILTNSGVL